MWENLTIHNSIEEDIKRNGNQVMRLIMRCRIFVFQFSIQNLYIYIYIYKYNLYVVLYGCGTQSLTLREEGMLGVLRIAC